MYNRDLDEQMNHLHCVLDVLRKEKLYANFRKRSFCMDKVLFLGFILSAQGMKDAIEGMLLERGMG